MRKTIKMHIWIYKSLNPTLEGIVTKRKKRTRTRKRKQKEKRSERKEKDGLMMLILWGETLH